MSSPGEIFSSECIKRTVSGVGSGRGFELMSVARQELFAALRMVHSYGTSYTAWCLNPAEVSVREGDRNVIVYGFLVTSALSPPEVTDHLFSPVSNETEGTGGSSGKSEMLGDCEDFLKWVSLTPMTPSVGERIRISKIGPNPRY